MEKWKSPQKADEGQKGHAQMFASRAALPVNCLQRVSFLICKVGVMVPILGVIVRMRPYDPMSSLWQRARELLYLTS